MPRLADPAPRAGPYAAAAGAARSWWTALLLVAAGPALAQGMLVAPPIHAYERGYREAAIVAQGDIVAYDAARGAMLRVDRVARGDLRAGSEHRLEGSAGYSFLATLPREVTAFIAGREGRALTLWQGPTSGGLIWSEPGLLERIERAHADPAAALRAADPRERLAAAYYRATAAAGGAADKGTPSAAELDIMVDSAAWGLTHGSPSTHQAAVDTLAALGHRLDALGIAYHPLFKAELKEEAARRLRAWWVQRRR